MSAMEACFAARRAASLFVGGASTSAVQSMLQHVGRVSASLPSFLPYRSAASHLYGFTSSFHSSACPGMAASSSGMGALQADAASQFADAELALHSDFFAPKPGDAAYVHPDWTQPATVPPHELDMAEIEAVRNSIFGTPIQPLERTGRRALARPLVGKEKASWYFLPPQVPGFHNEEFEYGLVKQSMKRRKKESIDGEPVKKKKKK